MLKHILTGGWSRRIDEANRPVYFVTVEYIVILPAREHFSPPSHQRIGH